MKKTPSRLQHIVNLLALMFVFALPTLAQRQERTVQNWRPLHYDVELAFNDDLTELTAARTTISVQVLAPKLIKIDLDFGDLPIDSVLVAGKPVQYGRSAESLSVILQRVASRGQKFNLTISYHGHPKDGLVFAKDRDGNPSATGDNWPNRVHYWIPSLDHPSAKATASFTVSAPQRYEVLANGKFVTLTGNAATSHWKFEEAKPIPPYCMIVAVNQGVIINTPDQAVTKLLLNVSQRDRDYAAKGFSTAAPALAFFNQTIAPYPYEKLALIVGATRFGGMENSSAIVFTSTLFDLRQNEKMSTHFGIPLRVEDVVAHEIAHQWFGDSVTESTWADLWLSEGFATYFAGLFLEKYEGAGAFHEYMTAAAQRYFRYEKQTNTPIHDTTTPDLMRLLNPNNYEKGAWVLHMLRMRLGDEAFFKGLRAYYLAHASGNATTEDLRAALEKSSGKNLKDFFARWVYGSGHPIYELKSSTKIISEKNSVTTVTIRQVQAGVPFDDPIPVVISLKSLGLMDQRVSLTPKNGTATAEFRFPRAPDAVLLDPDGTLLKEVTK